MFPCISFVESGPVCPDHPIAGQTYFNTTTHHVHVYDGCAWRQLIASGHCETAREEQVMVKCSHCGTFHSMKESKEDVCFDLMAHRCRSCGAPLDMKKGKVYD